MIYLFYGSDVEKVRSKAFAWVEAARAKSPDLAYVRLSREELTPNALEDAAHSGGLFVRRILVLIDDPFAKTRGDDEGEGDEGGASLGEDELDLLAKSDNAIIIVAPKLLVAKAKKITAKAAKAYEFNAPARADARGFNAGLVNALAARSPEKLWLEVARALRAGDAPEMLHGLLHWKARDVMDLPAGRQGKGAWTPEEARALSLSLIALLQDSRRTGANLALALEKFTLSI